MRIQWIEVILSFLLLLLSGVYMLAVTYTGNQIFIIAAVIAFAHFWKRQAFVSSPYQPYRVALVDGKYCISAGAYFFLLADFSKLGMDFYPNDIAFLVTVVSGFIITKRAEHTPVIERRSL